MILFDSKKYNEGMRTFTYSVNEYDLMLLGEERSKMLLSTVALERLEEIFPNKKEELAEYIAKLQRCADNCFDNAETQLILFGIDKIMWNLFLLLRDDFEKLIDNKNQDK